MRGRKKRMRYFSKFVIGLLVFGISIGNAAESYSGSPILRAQAIIQGPGIYGVVSFTEVQIGTYSPVTAVLVIAYVAGLPPGRHGMHIHEFGSCADSTNAAGMIVPFGGAGGHFDPGPKGDTNPDFNHPFHMGDLPNLVADERGIAYLQYVTSRISLLSGPLSVFDHDGSAVIIHQNEDLGKTSEPNPAGTAGGSRSACGVIN